MNHCGECLHYRVNRYLESICTLTGKNVGYLWEAKVECFEKLRLPAPPTEDNKLNSDNNKLTQNAMETPNKKICKCCGKELTIDNFQPNPKCKDGHLDTCKVCMNAKRAASHEAKKNGIPAPKENATKKIKDPTKPYYEPTMDVDPFEPFKVFSDYDLVAELRSRGWMVTCTKTIEL